MSKRDAYCQVAPAVPLPAPGRQTYTYRLPAGGQPAVRKHSCVAVPFGRRVVPGVVTKLKAAPPGGPVKNLARVSSCVLSARQVALARWIALTSHGGLGYTLRLFFPPGGLFAEEFVQPDAGGGADAVSRGQVARTRTVIDEDVTRRCRTVGRIIARSLRQKKQVLVVVPEKWLALRLAACLKKHGPAVVHASLSVSDLTEIWQQAAAGLPRLVIGTQKALFMPFTNLDLVIVEEEQYTTHKLWDQYPRLHNIYGARQLAKLHGAGLMLTSSWPSLELRYRLQRGRADRVVERPGRLRASLAGYSFEDRVKRYPLPSSFVSSLRKWVKDREEVLLFYNQRDAGYLNRALKNLKLPAENLTISTSAIFASAPKKKFGRVAWVNPERSLSYPDFRSEERSLITLSRLRGILASRRRHVVLVSRRPDLAERTLLADPAAVFNRLLKERERYYYPPLSDLVVLTISGKTKAAADKKAAKICGQIDREVEQLDSQIKVRGPFHRLGPPAEARRNAHILLSGPLDRLTDIYKDLPVDTADLAPERIL